MRVPSKPLEETIKSLGEIRNASYKRKARAENLKELRRMGGIIPEEFQESFVHFFGEPIGNGCPMPYPVIIFGFLIFFLLLGFNYLYPYEL